MESGQVEEKVKKVMNRYDPGQPGGLIWQNPIKNPVATY